MPLRNTAAFKWAPHGCSDAIDASNAFPGAMAELVNYVPSPDTNDQFVPRPARDNLTNFIATGLYVNPGTISNFTIVGDFAYGLMATGRNPGRDEPFCVGLISGEVHAVANISANNTPTAQPPSGQTQLPLFAKVGGRILVTAPGFPGGKNNPPLTLTFTANVHAGRPVVDGLINVAPQILPGMSITGTAIPSGAVVLSTSSVDFSVTASGTVGMTFFTVSDISQIRVGQLVSVAGTAGYVTSVTAMGNVITFNGAPFTATFANAVASFHGNELTMSQDATADLTSQPITVTAAGDRNAKFGWFDISGASFTHKGDTAMFSPQVTMTDVSGVQPGFLVTGNGILPGTVVDDISNPTLTAASQGINAGDTTLYVYFGTLFIPGQTPPFQLPINGQSINGPGLAAGTTVSGTPVIVGSASNFIRVSVPLSAGAATSVSSQSGFLYRFEGVAVVTLSQPAQATASGVTLTFTGGTPDAPLWDAGDTAINPLPSTPIGVGEFNGRAYFACGEDGIPFSDSLLGCVRTNASQALKPGNGLAVTHCVGQPLNTPITGGIVQALYAFQGASAIQQITGDQVTGDLKMNALNVGTGTLGPASIVPTTIGMIFVSPEGLRMIDFNGNVSQPVGEAGSGVTAPFINVFDPTRMVAGANGDVIRISVQNARTLGGTREEWWFDLARKIWTGPHSLQTSALAPYVDTFITAASDIPAMLYKSPCFPSGLVDYEEDGSTIVCRSRTALLPDTEAMCEHACPEGTIGMVLPSDKPMLVEALDENGALLGEVVIPGNFTMPLFGAASEGAWGAGLWYAAKAFYNQFRLDWPQELVFKQISIRTTTTARFGHAIGALRLRYRKLGYMLQTMPSVPMDIMVPPLPNAPVVNGFFQALVVSAAAPQFTVIGAVLVRIAHLGPAIPANQLDLTLTFDQDNRFAVIPYESFDVTGNTTGTPTITTAVNVLTLGWLPGHSISDDAGVIPRGTFIRTIDPTGTFITLSAPPTRVVTGIRFLVEGNDLVTNWTAPIPPGRPVGELRAVAPGNLTSYLDFLVTVQ